MLRKIKELDPFLRNIVFVFLGTSFGNLLNLLYQLLIAHKLSGSDFAAFNSLLAIFMLFAAPFGTLQLAIAKFVSAYCAGGQKEKAGSLLSFLTKRCLFGCVLVITVFCFASPAILSKLNIVSLASGYLLAFLVASSLITPVLAAGIQGLELFGWAVIPSVAAGLIKIGLTAVFLALGYNISGALGGFLLSNLLMITLYYYPLRHTLTAGYANKELSLKKLFAYMVPVAAGMFFYTFLISFDMVLVRSYLSAQDSGAYAISQMLGKIFLFLPGAVSFVLFPRSSGLHASSMDTRGVLKKSLAFALFLCLGAALFYNLFPDLVLKILTGKTGPHSVLLGRFFSFSMTFFALLYVFINYFLSIHDFRFIKYLALGSLAQFLAITFFHDNVFQVQYILSISAFSLTSVCYFLSFGRNK